MAPNQSLTVDAVPVLYQHSKSFVYGYSSESTWEDDLGSGIPEQLFFVTSYTDFEKLAHGPRGKEASYPISVYRFVDGSMVLVNKTGRDENTVNPAFNCFHPRLNVVYSCTEDIGVNGQITAYAVRPGGELSVLGHVDAGGTSTCYLTVDHEQCHLLVVNYWSSTVCVVPISSETGEFLGPVKSSYDCKFGTEMVAAPKRSGGVNHSHNDESTIKARQADPHCHALVLDPQFGCVAFVPDLGKDIIREFYYNSKDGMIEFEMHSTPSGLNDGVPDGPRYIEFHPTLDIAYVVNELSSTVAVFQVDRTLLAEISKAVWKGEADASSFKGKSALRFVQSISTLPKAFSIKMNTCGRICVHPSGRFVLVSNRGHESITIFRVQHSGRQNRGELGIVGFFHTHGETPRHFEFDNSGQFLLVANQDTDCVQVFSFNLSTGEMKYTGNEYKVPSPNFLCCCPLHDDTSMVGENASDVTSEKEQESASEKEQESASSETRLAKSPTYFELEAELQRARAEIDLLKKQVSELNVKD